MNSSHVNKKGNGLICSVLFSAIILLAPFRSEVFAGDWSVNGSIQYLTGDYIYTTATSTYYLTGGIGYLTDRWNFGIAFPIIAQSNNLVYGSGGMLLPGHEGVSNSDGGNHGQGMHGGRIMTNNVGHHLKVGLGDVYLSGQYQLFAEKNSLPSVAITGQFKYPTASNDFGTGEYDYGTSVNISKRLGNYAGFLALGYWFLGDPPEVDYRNPITYGIGLGRFFNGEKYSALIYYQGYTTILSDFDPPISGSLSLYYDTKSNTVLSITISAGFSSTSPDFGLSIVFNHNL